MAAYSSLFSWRYPIDDYAIGHFDGSVSIAITWAGTDYSTVAISERDGDTSSLTNAFSDLPSDVFIENHLFRFADSSRCDAYVAQADKAVRCNEIAKKTRVDVANLLSDYAMKNEILTVFTLSRHSVKGNATDFSKQLDAAELLREKIRNTVSHLAGYRYLTCEELGLSVIRHNDPDRIQYEETKGFIEGFHLNDQWISDKPEWQGRFLKVGDTFTWVGLLDLYPSEVFQGWSEQLSKQANADIHICQLGRMGNAGKAVLKAEEQMKSESQKTGFRGGFLAQKKGKNAAAFGAYISSNNLDVINNCYIVCLSHTDARQLEDLARAYRSFVKSSGGRVRDSKEIQFGAWRVAHPAQGYKSLFMRPDALDLFVGMAPFTQFDQGLKRPLMMRLSAQNELIYFDLPDGGANHGFSAGKTRSGKGAEKVMRVLETYPQGVDFYCIEYGGSYRWVTEALGGTYINLDPDKVYINPFPTYEEVNSTRTPEGEISTRVVGFSISALAPFLTAGKKSFSEIPDGNHHISRATDIFKYLYQEGPDDESKTAPTFGEFLAVAEMMRDVLEQESKNSQDYRSCVFLYENLNSFLNTPAGARFNTPKGSLDLTGDCIAIDIKPLVSMGDPQILGVYLSSIIMRLTNKVIANRSKAELAIDEYHLPAKLAPDLVREMAALAAKTWAKENGIFEIISQSPSHVDAEGDTDVTANMNHMQFLFMEDEHDEFARKFKLPDLLRDRWKDRQYYPEPSSVGLPYRQAIRRYGDKYYELMIHTPKFILQLAASNPKDLDIKDFIDFHMDSEGMSIWKKLEWFEYFSNELKKFDDDQNVLKLMLEKFKEHVA